MDIKQLIESQEGRMRLVYDDATGIPITKGYAVQGNPTIGVGFLVSAPGGLSNDEIDWIFDYRLENLKKALAEALPWSGDLSENRQAVLLSMAWQMGINGLLGFKNALNACQQGKYDIAAAAMLQSRWADQTPERAQVLAKMMIDG